MSFEVRPELSVIVPVFNEEADIPRFLRVMAIQREIAFEVIISDGGSKDRTVAVATGFPDSLPFQLRVIEGGKGRAVQMNAAAAVARAHIFLFLHIDSSFPDPLSLRKGVDALTAASKNGKATVAGHFPLQFHFEGETPLPYRFYGAKASLDRRGCTHGDQGLLIPAQFFEDIGGFNPALPLMEDTFLAERIREVGTWLLLPAGIKTSPRRFLTEGLRSRQTLNALLMNLAMTGHFHLIESLKDCYRSQDSADRLKLHPFLVAIKGAIAALPPDQRRALWRKTGAYVRENAWQIPFFLDFLCGRVGEGKGGVFLAVHDRLVGRLMANEAADWAAAGLVWVWFQAALYLGDA